LRRQLGGRRLRLTDDDRRRLAVRAFRVGRRALREIATIVTPDTLFGCGVLKEIRQLIVRMAGENPTWGYTRIQGAVKNVGHRVGRSTIARILKAAGVPPVPERPTWWQTFLRAHWGAIAGADFFTTEVWTRRGLMTFYTVFVNDLASRRVQIVGSTPYPDERFMQQVVRTLIAAEGGLLVQHHVLICDQDTKWSAPVRAQFGRRGDPRGADAVSGAECKRLRRTVCAVDQGRVSQPPDPVRRRSSSPKDCRIPRALSPGA
jgi:hypothetical protein